MQDGQPHPLAELEKHEDGWNWPMLLYVGRSWLNMEEDEFWQTTPRKLQSLAAVHEKFNFPQSGAKKEKPKPQLGYIDQIEGW